MELPAHPASAAGPDLRQIVLGSEGRFGIITRATVHITSLPQVERFYGMFFPNWEAGLEAVRGLAQARIQLSLLRLSDALETETTLALSGRTRLTHLARWGLNLLGIGSGRCLLIMGISGEKALVRGLGQEAIAQAARQPPGLPGPAVSPYTGGVFPASRRPQAGVRHPQGRRHPGGNHRRRPPRSPGHRSMRRPGRDRIPAIGRVEALPWPGIIATGHPVDLLGHTPGDRHRQCELLAGIARACAMERKRPVDSDRRQADHLSPHGLRCAEVHPPPTVG